MNSTDNLNNGFADGSEGCAISRRCGFLFVNICCCMICSGNNIFKELETQFSQTPTRPERVAADHIGYTGPRAIGGSLTDREFLSGSLSVFLNF